MIRGSRAGLTLYRAPNAEIIFCMPLLCWIQPVSSLQDIACEQGQGALLSKSACLLRRAWQKNTAITASSSTSACKAMLH